MNNVSKDRRKLIKNTVFELLSNYKNIYLPVPIKSIVKSLPNCRLVKYSKYLQDNKLSKKDISTYFNSNDAVSDCKFWAGKMQYIIYYNDMDESINSSNRYRWNIAHELGHILLQHHSNPNTRLFRNALSEQQYKEYEKEADMFAAYLLVPHSILYFQEIHNPSDIARLCKISKSASNTRWSEYIDWYNNSRLSEQYDRDIQNIYYRSPKTQDKIFCSNCKTNISYNSDYHYCYICGKNKARYIIEGDKMIYEGIEVDNIAKAIKCPICGNEELSNGDYCKICGSYVINKCESENEFGIKSSCIESIAHPLPGNARFCPYCGSKTSFLNLGYLSTWENNDIITDDTLPF